MPRAAKLLILVDPSSGIPVYRQLIDQVKLVVASGALRPGDALPSTRALSAQLGVNPMTVSKAYGLLEREGLVERRPGLPLIVLPFDNRPLEAQRVDRLRERLEPVVRLVRQLGIERDQAVALLREMLAEDEK